MKKLSWGEYRKKKWAFLISIVAIFVIFSMLLQWLGLAVACVATFIFFIGVIFPIASRFARFPCPNCGNPIHESGAWAFTGSSKCLHCGIEIYQENAE